MFGMSGGGINEVGGNKSLSDPFSHSSRLLRASVLLSGVV